MTNAEKALGLFETEVLAGLDLYLGQELTDAIRRALKIAAAVDGDGLEIKYGKYQARECACIKCSEIRGNNDLLERLRGIK